MTVEERLALATLILAAILIPTFVLLPARKIPPGIEPVCVQNTDSVHFLTLKSDLPGFGPIDRDGDGTPDSRRWWWWWMSLIDNVRRTTEAHLDRGTTALNEAIEPLRLDLNALKLALHISARQHECGILLLGELT